MCVGNIFFTVLPWPFAAVAAAHAGAAGRGSSRRLGPPGASGSHNTLCRGPPYTCGESAGTLPYPAVRGGEKDGLVRTRAKGKERREYCKKSVSEKNSIEKTMIKVQGVVVFFCLICVYATCRCVRTCQPFGVSMFVQFSLSWSMFPRSCFQVTFIKIFCQTYHLVFSLTFLNFCVWTNNT